MCCTSCFTGSLFLFANSRSKPPLWEIVVNWKSQVRSNYQLCYHSKMRWQKKSFQTKRWLKKPWEATYLMCGYRYRSCTFALTKYVTWKRKHFFASLFFQTYMAETSELQTPGSIWFLSHLLTKCFNTVFIYFDRMIFKKRQSYILNYLPMCHS